MKLWSLEVFHISLELVKMLQPCKKDLFARLLDLTSQEDLVEDGVDLVEVEDQI